MEDVNFPIYRLTTAYRWLASIFSYKLYDFSRLVTKANSASLPVGQLKRIEHAIEAPNAYDSMCYKILTTNMYMIIY